MAWSLTALIEGVAGHGLWVGRLPHGRHACRAVLQGALGWPSLGGGPLLVSKAQTPKHPKDRKLKGLINKLSFLLALIFCHIFLFIDLCSLFNNLLSKGMLSCSTLDISHLLVLHAYGKYSIDICSPKGGTTGCGRERREQWRGRGWS